MRIVFLKSLKDQSGYALYGNPPRWHKVSAENPAPSDAHHVALSHYHVAAVKKLKDSHHASAKSAAEMAAEAKDLGANLQAAASASAAVSGWKAAMLAGKKPTASQQAAFDALPDAKKAELLAAVGSAQATADPKDAALQAAIDHLKEDAQQDDLPAHEKAEDAALVEKMEGANGAEPFPTFADHDKADAAAQEGPKEGDTKQKDGKTYVLKNGRWRLQVSEQEAAEDKADLADALLSGDNAKASELVAKLHEVEHGHEAEQPAQDTQSPVPAAQAVDTHAESAPADGAGHQPGTLEEASAKHAEAQQYLTDALEGKLGHYPGKAAMKVSADLPLFEKVEAIKHLAAEMQAAASLSAAFSGWKKSAAQGKNPTPAQWKAFYAQPKDKQASALADVEKVAGSLGHLSAPAVELPADSPKAAAAALAAPKVTAAIDDSSLWHQTGPQKGSNPGGKFKDASGQEWYVKTPATEAHVKNEILAAELYKAAGVAAPDLKTVRHHGKLSVASKWVDGLSKGSASDLANNAGATSGFGVDAWLANWDAVGLEFDNLLTAGGGQAVRIDVGGSLLFRAQGEAKGADFGDKVTETKTLLDAKKNPNTAAVFCSMSKEDMEAAVGKVLAVSDEKIKELCAKHAPGTSAEKMALASKLIARKADLAKQFPGAAKAQKLAKFKPDDLSPPPNFLDWGGSGKAGPSSKSFINEANHSASQAIWAAAKTGDPEAVKSLTAPVFDKESGQVTGRVPVLSHPSQWVKGFAQQMLNEIDYQMNPPKKFRFDGGHPLAALDSAYPVAKVGAGGAAKKLGEFLVLGAPGTVDLAPEFKPDPITYKSGKLTQKTFSKAAQAAIAKLPDTQKQAIKAYTGSSYSEMNKSLWAGNQAGEAKAAAEGLHAVGHEITPGTVLSRRLKLSSIDVAQLEKAAGQILQEPAIMSTSIRPSCWTGGKNVSIKLNVGPGVKGLYVGPHSLPGGGALSKNDSEDEVILPPNTRLLVQQVTRTNKKDADGFGGYDAEIIVEVLVLPTKE